MFVAVRLPHCFNSFHNKLKTTYLDGKVNRRVDFLIDALLRLERDQFFRSMYKNHMFQVNLKEQSEEQRHVRGLQIPYSAVEVTTLFRRINKVEVYIFRLRKMELGLFIALLAYINQGI